MLGFGKKKAQKDAKEKAGDSPQTPEEGKAGKAKPDKSKDKAAKGGPPAQPTAQPPAAKPRKKRFSIVKLVMILVILGLLGGGGFAGYTFFFKAAKEPAQRIYAEVPLPHLTLPKEMIRFCFDHFPMIYDAFLTFESELKTFEDEITRVDEIAAKYPDQQKIAEAQKKIWEKGKNTLLKEFAKLEKPVKETFVLYQVNPQQGQAQIESLSKDLSATAQAALKEAGEMTGQIRAMAPAAPQGYIQETFQKLKKKFL